MSCLGTRASRQDGFTLVEVMVAATILIVGLLGTFVLVDGANGTLATNNARIGATNLAREIVEHSRSSEYEKLNPAQIAGALQAKPGLAGTGNPWSVDRRGVSYEITVSVCTVDDPKDGLAAVPPVNACPRANAIAGAPAEANPDDFRKVETTLSWTASGRERSLTQAALIVNPSGGLGPRIVAFPELTGQIASSSQTQVAWTGTLKTTGAASVHWTADDGGSQGDATGGSTDWTLVWDIGTYGSGQFVHDGAYTLTAQAFDSRGVAGESRTVTVLLNRGRPFAPTYLSGGHNATFGSGGVVDLMWAPSPERDVLGYRVYRLNLLGGRDERICPAPTSASEYIETTSCTDPDPPSLSLGTRYEVVAVDRQDLAQPVSPVLEGAPATITILPAGTAPPAPSDVISSTDAATGLPRLNWTQAAATPPILFYRIYRDPASTPPTIADRYAYTASADPTWSDPDPGNATGHTYWITAVDERFHESDPVGPVTWGTP
jgi:hypothetical protein